MEANIQKRIEYQRWKSYIALMKKHCNSASYNKLING